MNKSAVYEQVLMTDGLRKMKNLRDSMNAGANDFDLNINYNFGTVAGLNDDSYRLLMKQVDGLNDENIEQLILKLLEAYKIEYKSLIIPWKKVRVSIEAKIPIFMEPNNVSHVLMLAWKDTLFIFKKYGLHNHLIKEVLNNVKKKHNIDNYKYISLIEGNAYSEVLNHNNDVNDPSRGTHCYSLEYFFNLVFGKEEYELFKSYFESYSQKIKEYFGLVVVKTLHPNTLFSFKNEIKKTLVQFDYILHESDYSSHHITNEQLKLINDQFLNNKLYELLIGNSEYARCFITAEWLFSSFGEIAGSIDLTAISMGYYKALEQFMFEMISMYTVDKGFPDRKITFPRNDLVPLTDEVMEKEKKSFTMGSMTKFLTSRFNNDILRNDIDEETQHFVFDVLNCIKDQRNGYFHKDNILDWEKIKKDRNLTLITFFVLLGAYKFNSNRNQSLMLESSNNNDYEKACEYFDNVAHNFNSPEIPILYTSTDNMNNFFLIDADTNKSFDKNGKIKYSGIYIHSFDENNKPVSRVIKKDDFAELSISQGRLIIKKDLLFKITPTGPEKVIVKTGKFCIDENLSAN